jgi:hypothetical protein
MHRPLGRRRLAPAALIAALALAGTASAAVTGLPPDGSQVNDDAAAGIDPTQDAGVNDVVGGSLAAGGVNVPWAAFEQKQGLSQQIFVRAFKNGRWTTQGSSLNIEHGQEAEAPSIDFAGAGRTVPWTAWYEPNSHLGSETQIFASRFDAARGDWVPEGQDRTSGSKVPSLNLHVDQEAENPAVAGGATVAGNAPVPWVAWQETDGTARKNQIFVSRAIKQTDCSANLPNQPGTKQSVSAFCWQQVGLERVNPSTLSFDAAGDPSLSIDPKRDAIEPDMAFTGPNDTVPWVVWYEQGTGTSGLRSNEQVFAAKAVADPTADGGLRWVAVGNGTAGQTNVLNASGGCSSSQAAEDACALNLVPGHDAEDPRVAAGTQKPGGTTVPWVTWSEDTGSGTHAIFVSKLVGDHFELLNGGKPISIAANESNSPDITFSGHTPYVSWVEDLNGAQPGGFRTILGHFEGDAFKVDSTAGGVDGIRSPISSGCIATPFSADGGACPGAAAGTPFFTYLNDDTGTKRLLAKAYSPTDVTTGSASGIGQTSATLTGLLNPAGATTKVHFEYGPTAAYGLRTADQLVGPATTPVSVAAAIGGLAPSSTVHFRIVAETDFGLSPGADATFATLPAGGGGGGGGGGGDHKAPRLALLGKAKVHLDRHGRVHLKVRSNERARGTLKLRALKGKRLYGARHVTLAAGARTKVVVKLTRAGRRYVRLHHALSVREILRVHDAAGNTASASHRLRIVR